MPADKLNLSKQDVGSEILLSGKELLKIVHVSGPTLNKRELEVNKDKPDAYTTVYRVGGNVLTVRSTADAGEDAELLEDCCKTKSWSSIGEIGMIVTEYTKPKRVWDPAEAAALAVQPGTVLEGEFTTHRGLELSYLAKADDIDAIDIRQAKKEATLANIRMSVAVPKNMSAEALAELAD